MVSFSLSNGNVQIKKKLFCKKEKSVSEAQLKFKVHQRTHIVFKNLIDKSGE